MTRCFACWTVQHHKVIISNLYPAGKRVDPAAAHLEPEARNLARLTAAAAEKAAGSVPGICGEVCVSSLPRPLAPWGAHACEPRRRSSGGALSGTCGRGAWDT